LKLALLDVAVARPVPVTVTWADAGNGDPPAAYCTLTVQFPPGFSTIVPVQLPPGIIEKPPGPLTFATVGAAVNVNGPAVAPEAELVTVTSPDSVTVLAGLLVNAGVGPENATVAPVTVKVTGLLATPLGFVTVMFLPPSVAAPEMEKVAVN